MDIKIQIQRIFYLLSIMAFSPLWSQSMNTNPLMIQQALSLPPAEQQKLAEQYGVDISALGAPNTINSSETSNLDSDLSIMGDNSATINEARRIIKNQDNEEVIDELERNATPIFERNYEDIEKFPLFGKKLFDGSGISTFAPVDNAPVPDNYRIGIGDNINVILYGSQNGEYRLSVDRTGSVNFPQLGNLSIAGMTFEKASEYIESRVSEQMIGVNASISMGKLRTINVFLAGEARMPGSYTISALSTISQLLFSAGGVSEIGSLRNIQLNSPNSSRHIFDLYDLISKGDISGDKRLKSGDVVFIPTVDQIVIIDGAVKRPGRYELQENDDINELISLAGGVTNKAYLKKISIETYDANTARPIIKNLDLTDKLSFSHELNDGDIVKIASNDNYSNSMISIRGAVQRPGKYGYFPGIRFSDIIENIDRDLEENIDLNIAIIAERVDEYSRDIKIKSFSVKDAIESPRSNLDPELQKYDEILVFSLVDKMLTGGQTDLILVESDVDEGLAELNKKVQESNFNLFGDVNPMMAPGELVDVISDQEYKKIIEYKKEINQQRELRKGDRIDLLKPVIQKLYRQASVEKPVMVVSISGGVKQPGEYPLIDNASFSDIVLLAGGFSEDAFTDKAELRRLVTDDSGLISTQLREISIGSRLDETISSFKLESRDHIKIQKIKDWDVKDSIILEGEIMYPGEYLISPNETLSSVIDRAGGFTSEAFIESAVFTRESIKEKEREQLQILGDTIRRDQASRSMTKESEDFSISSKEIEDGISALLSTEVIGRLIIDLPRLVSGDEFADIVLQHGDVLHIPKYTNAVTVVGEVRRSGSFVRQDSYNLDDYIELAAGMTSRGNKKEIYVIRANGSVYKGYGISTDRILNFSNNNNSILAGDTIVVPIKSSYQTPLNMYRTVSQVVFQSIASIAAFGTLFNN